MSSVKAFLELARWPNALMAAAGVLVGAFFLSTTEMSAHEFGGRWRVALVALAAIALTVTANAWNDAADAAIDRVAHPARPIPTGRISADAARKIALAAAVTGVGLAGAASRSLGALTVVVVLLMLVYSPWLKRTVLVGNVTAAFLASLPFLYGAWAAGEPDLGLFLVSWAFPLHFAREIAKDIDDAPADAGHRRTVPLQWGLPAARTLVVVALLWFLIEFPLLEWWPGLLWAMLPAYCLVALGGLRVLRGAPGAPRALKAAMLLAMLALVFATAVPALRPVIFL